MSKRVAYIVKRVYTDRHCAICHRFAICCVTTIRGVDRKRHQTIVCARCRRGDAPAVQAAP